MNNRLPLTGEDTVGPYYPVSFLDADRADLTAFAGLTVEPAGEALVLRGVVLDVERTPVAPVLLEFQQADGRGELYPFDEHDDEADPWFDPLSRQYCETGRFELRTIRPGVAPGSGRAPHLTLNIFCDGFSRVATQIFLEGDPRNDGDPLLASLPEALRPRLIARRDGDGAYAIEIVLRGEGETPFFDDLEESDLDR